MFECCEFRLEHPPPRHTESAHLNGRFKEIHCATRWNTDGCDLMKSPDAPPQSSRSAASVDRASRFAHRTDKGLFTKHGPAIGQSLSVCIAYSPQRLHQPRGAVRLGTWSTARVRCVWSQRRGVVFWRGVGRGVGLPETAVLSRASNIASSHRRGAASGNPACERTPPGSSEFDSLAR